MGILLKFILKSVRVVLEIVGFLSIVGASIASYYVLKSYHYPPNIIALKILKKMHIESETIAEALEPEPVRPPHLKFPDPSSDGWRGHGARNDRVLQPIAYQNKTRPIPSGWRGKTDTGSLTIPKYSNQVMVNNTKSFLRAIKAAKAGDEIILQPGIYKIKTRTINVLSPGTPEKPICVKAKQLGQVVLELNSLEGFLISAPFWSFENLDIKGTNPAHDYGEHAFHIVGQGRGFVLQNCRIHEFNAMIKANGGRDRLGKVTFPDNALIENNSFYNATIRRTSNPVTFIDVVGVDNWIVRGNFIADYAKGEGDTISYAAFIKGNASGSIFENNLVIGEYRHTGGVRVGLSFGGGGTGKQFARNKDITVEHSNGVMRNNVIMYCKDVGIYLNKADGTKIYHNLLYRTMGIDVRFPESTARIENNVLTGRIAERDGGQSVLKNNVVLKKGLFRSNDLSKWFEAPEVGNFALKDTSFLVDKATPETGVFEDICGNKRDGKPDIGPFEYREAQHCPLISPISEF